MTTEASKSDSLTAALTQDREAPLTATEASPRAILRVDGVEIPYLKIEGDSHYAIYWDADSGTFRNSLPFSVQRAEVSITVKNEHDYLRRGSIVEVFSQDSTCFTGRLLSRKIEGNNVVYTAIYPTQKPSEAPSAAK